MGTRQVLRACGIAAVLAGVLIIVAGPFHPGDSIAEWQSTAWRIVHLAELAAFILILPALVGLYALQAERAPGLSAVGFACAIAGTGLIVGIVFVAEFVLPVLAAQAPALLDETGPLLGGAFGQAFLAALMLAAAGFVLMGIASVRARMLPPWSAWAFVIAGPLYAFGEMLGKVAFTAGALLFGAAFIAAGLVVVRKASTTMEVAHVG